MTDYNSFQRRHIGISDASDILKFLGVNSPDDLSKKIFPSSLPRYFDDKHDKNDKYSCLSEEDTRKKLASLAGKNNPAKSFIGTGYVGSIMPAAIRRHLLENAGWYTSYTPYQAEISQGRLELLLVFQQITQDLTGFKLSGASLLDEATAAAEAMIMTFRASKTESKTFVISEDIYPQIISVVKTRAEAIGVKVLLSKTEDIVKHDCFGCLISYPSASGNIGNLAPIIATLKDKSIQTILACDPMALNLLKPPKELGADIAIGSFQSFGLPMGFGGPHPAFIAVDDEYKRHIPGRIIGVSKDRDGRPALRMALQTREQHIRRERATSNICTSQALPAMIAACYAIYHGPEGLKQIATKIHSLAANFAKIAKDEGYEVIYDNFFSCVTIQLTASKVDSIMKKAKENNLMLLQNAARSTISITFDETVDQNDFNLLLKTFDLKSNNSENLFQIAQIAQIAKELTRKDTILTDKRFHIFRNETAFMRYLRALQDKDLALDRAMIPLGSCTMKLNPATSMDSISLPGFSNMHPLAYAIDKNFVAGYTEIIDDLEDKLKYQTGFDAFSFQPNSGAQGEFAGLLAIKRFHESNNDSARNLCLIPTSAHGTNPASAVMAGFDVMPVICDSMGNIDIEDLKQKLQQNKEKVAALMVTYPSTHGIFEIGIIEVCKMVHDCGGQIYFDGANFNAMAGWIRPADLGADVGHLNLHKTYAIPHGGGGPGMGPIGVKQHLAKFLPGSPFELNKSEEGSVSAAPYGSALILAISWSYIAMLGLEGIRKSTSYAILAANYIAKSLKSDFPIVYSDKNGYVAHECIFDCRDFAKTASVDVESIAKRLIDYGFHAPTMSWPVAGCLMVEPTESEDKAELDRFIAAMKSIREEIRNIETGKWPKDNNPLVNAPHTLDCLTQEKWERPYTRKEAIKSTISYLAPVSRIDQVFGDRNLFCSCDTLI